MFALGIFLHLRHRAEHELVEQRHGEGHGAQKPLLAWREPVEADRKKILIQSLNHCRGGLLDDLQSDR